MGDKYIDSYFKSKSGGSKKVTSSSTSTKTDKSSDSYINSYFKKKDTSVKTPVAQVDSKIASAKKALDLSSKTIDYVDANWSPTDRDKSENVIKYNQQVEKKNKTSKNNGVFDKIKTQAIKAVNVGLGTGFYTVNNTLKELAKDKKPGGENKALSVLKAAGRGAKAAITDDQANMSTFRDVINTLLDSKNKQKRTLGTAMTNVSTGDPVAADWRAGRGLQPTQNMSAVTAKDIIDNPTKQNLDYAKKHTVATGLIGDVIVDPLNVTQGVLGGLREVARGSNKLKLTRTIQKDVIENGVQVLGNAGIEPTEAAIASLQRLATKTLGGSNYQGVKIIGKTVIKPEVAAKTGDVIRKALDMTVGLPIKGVKKLMPEGANRAIVNKIEDLKGSSKGKDWFLGGQNSDLASLARQDPENVLKYMATAQARGNFNIKKTMDTVNDARYFDYMAKGMTKEESRTAVKALEEPVGREAVVSKQLTDELSPNYVRSVTKFEGEMKRKSNAITSRISDLEKQIKATNNQQKLIKLEGEMALEKQMLDKMEEIKKLQGGKTYNELADYFVGEKKMSINQFFKGDMNAMADIASKKASDTVKSSKTLADLPRGKILHDGETSREFVNVVDYVVDNNGKVRAITDDLKSLSLNDLKFEKDAKEIAMTESKAGSAVNTGAKVRESNADLFNNAKKESEKQKVARQQEESAAKLKSEENIKKMAEEAKNKNKPYVATAIKNIKSVLEESKMAKDLENQAKFAEYEKMVRDSEKEMARTNKIAPKPETNKTPIARIVESKQNPIEKVINKTDSEKTIEVLEHKMNDKRISAREKAGYQSQINDVKKNESLSKIEEANKYTGYKKSAMDKAINKLEKGLGRTESDIQKLATMTGMEKSKLSHALLEEHRGLLVKGEDATKALDKAKDAKASKPIDDAYIEMNDVKQSDSRGGKVSMNPKDDLELASPEKGEQLEKQFKYLEDLGYDMSHFDSGVRDAIKNRTLTNAEYKEAIKPLKEAQASKEVVDLKIAQTKANRETVLTDGKFKYAVMQSINDLPNKVKLTPEAKDLVKRISNAKTKGELFDIIQDIEEFSKLHKLGFDNIKLKDYQGLAKDTNIAEKGTKDATNAFGMKNTEDSINELDSLKQQRESLYEDYRSDYMADHHSKLENEKLAKTEKQLDAMDKKIAELESQLKNTKKPTDAELAKITAERKPMSDGLSQDDINKTLGANKAPEPTLIDSLRSSPDEDIQSLMREYDTMAASQTDDVAAQVEKIVNKTEKIKAKNTKLKKPIGKYMWEGDEEINGLVFDYNGTRITVDKKASSSAIKTIIKELKNLPEELKPLAKDIRIVNGKLLLDDVVLQGLESSKSVNMFSNRINNASKASKALGDKAGRLSNTAHVLRHELIHVADNQVIRNKITTSSQKILKELSPEAKNELADLLLNSKNSTYGSNKEAILQRLDNGHISRYASSTTGETMYKEHTAELAAAMYGDDAALASKLNELMPDVKKDVQTMLMKSNSKSIKGMLPKGVKNKDVILGRIEGLKKTYKATEEALAKDAKVLFDAQTEAKYLKSITTGNNEILEANDPIVKAFAELHPELEGTKFQQVYRDVVDVFNKYPEDELPAHLHEFTKIFKDRMKEIGVEEGISNMIERYIPHVLNPIYAKNKQAKNMFRELGFDEPFNKFAQTRSDMRTIEEINKYMDEKHGMPNYLQDTMESLYLQRSLYHNQFMWEKGMTDMHLNMWGEKMHNKATVGKMTPEELEKFTEQYNLPVIGTINEKSGHTITQADVMRDYHKYVTDKMVTGQFMMIRKGDEFTPMEDIVTVSKEEAQASYERANSIKTEAWRTKGNNQGNTAVADFADRVIRNPYVEIDPRMYKTQEMFEKNMDNMYMMPVNVYNNYQKVMKNQFRQSQILLTKLTDPIVKVFKYSATVANPTFHMTNIFGNLLNSYLGIGAHILDPELHMLAIQAVRGSDKIIEGGKTAKEWNELLIKHGVFGGEFFSKDIQKTVKSSRDLFHDIRDTTGAMKKVKKVLGAPQNIASKIEEQNKALNFFAHIRNGKSIEEAAELTNKYTFDYGDLTMFENNVMKRIVPFYTWMRKNIPLQLEQLIEQPEKYARMNKIAGAVSQPETVEENQLKPEYLANAFKVGKGTYMNMNLPMNDIYKLLSPKDLFSSLNPLLKMMVELPTGKNVYFDSEIKNYKDEMVKAPTFTKAIPGLTESTPEGDFIDPRWLYALKGLLPNLASYGNVADAITGSGKKADQTKGAGYAAGFRLYQPDLAQAFESQKQDILNDLESKKKAAIKKGYLKSGDKNTNTISKAAEEAILKRYLGR